MVVAKEHTVLPSGVVTGIDGVTQNPVGSIGATEINDLQSVVAVRIKYNDKTLTYEQAAKFLKRMTQQIEESRRMVGDPPHMVDPVSYSILSDSVEEITAIVEELKPKQAPAAKAVK